MIPFSIAAALFLAQQPALAPKTVTSVQGAVVNALTGDGLTKATVILRSSDTEKGTSYAEEADSNGHFRIEDIQPGEYSVTAERQSYFQQPDGAPGSPPPRLKIAVGSQVDHVLIKMAPACSISGRVVDQDGDPIRGAIVRVMQYVYVSGKRELRPGVQVQARDNGEYRLFNLRPGRWFIQVSKEPQAQGWTFYTPVGSRSGSGAAVTFFPGVTDVSKAAPVELHAGDNLRGYDIAMRSEKAHAIRFSLPQGEYNNSAPQLLHRDGTGVLSQTVGFVVEDGKVEFQNVAAGSYTILVSRNDGSGPMYARADVDVATADVDVGELDFKPAREISGVLKIEGGNARLPQTLRINLQPEGAPGQIAGVDTKADGTFTLKGVIPAVYRILAVTDPMNLYLKSIRIGETPLTENRIDLTEATTDPLTVILGADVGEIEGSVKKADGNPAAHARLTLFPDGANASRFELFRFVFSDDEGHYKFKGLAPGDYRLFAWQDVLAGMPQDPDFRKRFEKQSVTVKIAPNGHEKADVTSISVAAARDTDP
jgi:Carboxypeptidase regulatory-like domain